MNTILLLRGAEVLGRSYVAYAAHTYIRRDQHFLSGNADRHLVALGIHADAGAGESGGGSRDPVAVASAQRAGVYDPGGDVKTNILSPIYEAVLADIRQTPVVGPMLLRIHGVLNVLLYLVAIGAVRELLRAGPGWQWTVMLVVPDVFHQFVLVKNELFAGVLGWSPLRGWSRVLRPRRGRRLSGRP